MNSKVGAFYSELHILLSIFVSSLMRDKSHFRLPGYICPPLDAAIWRSSWWDLWCRSGQTISNLKTTLMQQFEDHIAAEADRSAISRPSWCSILKIILMRQPDEHVDAAIWRPSWCRYISPALMIRSMQQYEEHIGACWCSNLKTILMQQFLMQKQIDQQCAEHIDAAIWRPSWCSTLMIMLMQQYEDHLDAEADW